MNDYSITEKVIRDIKQKLESDVPLTNYEKERVMYALNKVCDVKQVPYYEVIYHDEYDRTERRIMEPMSVRVRGDGHLKILEESFELNFNRILP